MLMGARIPERLRAGVLAWCVPPAVAGSCHVAHAGASTRAESGVATLRRGDSDGFVRHRHSKPSENSQEAHCFKVSVVVVSCVMLKHSSLTNIPLPSSPKPYRHVASSTPLILDPLISPQYIINQGPVDARDVL